ncbi:ankyrin repeat and MYND domain-containing protein 2 [Cimex lectularius]|uniref:MYND-type domain-containing protein n=1 Tax=Cimex lectularius TaxID=79782 RepID=A0A8I6R7D8_CIMLE|nr:ankyrin repeat and MYND domain-containing protein 2 [Cimex lectularius]
MASSRATPVPLKEAEKAIFELINNNDIAGLKSHMEINALKPDVVDEHGLTPLSHACYKGNKDIAQYLIDQGANVNLNEHENGYTALHFAALSGKADLCQLLLANGAKTHMQNSVGRTAAQMGAFVGNHQCVAVINNYLPKCEVDYYTISHSLNQGPFLSPTVATTVHKLIMQVNLHPIRIALTCQPLVDVLNNVKFVLEMMSQKLMRRGAESNEVLSFKIHYLSFVIGEIMKCRKPDQQTTGLIETFIKRILRNGSGEKFLESLIRESIREYPYRDCGIFHQMITSLTAFKNPPPALQVISTVINGQRGFESDVKVCTTCSEETQTKKCVKCKQVQYCGRECQRLHWFAHKKECNRNADDLVTKVEAIKIN